MNRIEKIINLDVPKENFFFWANESSTSVILDSNNYPHQSDKFDYIVVKGCETLLKLNNSNNAFEELKKFKNKTNDWIFGFLAYDLKNDTEDLSSKNDNSLNFPELLFFQPKKIILVKGKKATFSYLPKHFDDIGNDLNIIKQCNAKFETLPSVINLKSRTSKNIYLKKCKHIIDQIKLGNIYEINYCIEYYAKAIFSPLNLFLELNRVNKAPFSAFFKHNELNILSCSPERFLKKTGNNIIAQPIKGTRKRGLNLNEDNQLKKELTDSIKDRAENTMIVDLVRNDLSKIAKRNSVNVIEYCKIYTFESVHQMISTISCEIDNNIDIIDVIKENFPMGSMTGAPKINAMKYIEEFEDHKRGIYSGSIGYIKPNNDFDFNVIIRTLQYNSNSNYTSLSVGGAITALSDPEEEYEECLTKAFSILKVLTQSK